MSVILASASPRRRELMSLITNDFTVKTSDVDEGGITAASPELLVQALARAKGGEVAKSCPGDIVIASDTVVAVDGRVLGKPHSKEEAREMLRLLSGRTHAVHTGVCILKDGKADCFCDTCLVTFAPIEAEDLEAYIATDEPYDKAGAYAVQGHAALWLTRLEGNYYTVMGFPVSRVAEALRAL